MRKLIGLTAFAIAYALTLSAAEAQIMIPNADALVARLTAAQQSTRAAPSADAPAHRGAIGILAVNFAEQSSAAPPPPSAATASWVIKLQSVCIAGLATQGTEYTAAITTDNYVFVTNSTYGSAVVAANCASGRSIAFYVDSAGTVYDVASFAR